MDKKDGELACILLEKKFCTNEQKEIDIVIKPIHVVHGKMLNTILLKADSWNPSS